MNNSVVYPQLPNAGLGNMLLVWAKAILFAQINSLPVIAPNWNQIRIGPWLRGEKDKRYYGQYFSYKNFISRIQGLLLSLEAQKIYEPPISKLKDSNDFQPCIFIFRDIPHWSDYFGDIKFHHAIIREALFSIIHPHLLAEIETRPSPLIGIHVRAGDFRKLQPKEDFSQLGAVRTPIDWYISVLKKIRAVVGYNVPATIFSDGYDYELSDLLALPGVSRAAHASALSDMLTLSKSKLLITSAGSTFSGWASYLGRCSTVWHPAHFHSGVFSSETSSTTFEGGFDPEIMQMPYLLECNITSKFHDICWQL